MRKILLFLLAALAAAGVAPAQGPGGVSIASGEGGGRPHRGRRQRDGRAPGAAVPMSDFEERTLRKLGARRPEGTLSPAIPMKDRAAQDAPVAPVAPASCASPCARWRREPSTMRFWSSRTATATASVTARSCAGAIARRRPTCASSCSASATKNIGAIRSTGSTSASSRSCRGSRRTGCPGPVRRQLCSVFVHHTKARCDSPPA
jgi:hypothetical protein